jgi:hypothetical protein
MLRSLKDFNRYAVSATDGDIGVVGDFLHDDERWVVRYLVVETGGLLEGRAAVLVSPISFRHAEATSRRFHLALTMDKIKNSPRADTDQPVSRQYEQDYSEYYGHACYWGSAGLWGVGAYPAMLATSPPLQASDKAPGDVHLRSAKEIRGYHIQGSDEAIGHLDDLIVDDETWEVRYLVVDTSNWWFGKKVLVAPHWASGVSWEERKVFMDLRREEIKNSPEWNPTSAISREYEASLYDHYGRPRYWAAPVYRAKSPPPRHSGGHPG